MARSMTAYGRAQEVLRGKRITAELKSVNSRYLDCSVKAPAMYGFLEKKAETFLQKSGISRGKVSVYISVDRMEDQSVSMQLDHAYTETYLKVLRELRDQYELTDDITVMKVAQNKELFSVIREDEDADALWEDVQTVLGKALSAFVQMRMEEGAALCSDLAAKKEHLQQNAAFIAERSPYLTTEYRLRLEEKLQQVLQTYHVEADPARVLTECALFADRVAIDEELVRLQSHFDAFDRMLVSDEPVGRKLDFLLQEMNREVNTMGSKCNDAQIAAMVIDMKCELEKIREQIQNLE